MKPQKNKAFMVFTLNMLVAGCTSQSWYEGAKQGAENNCRNQPPTESQRCLENLNKKTYEEYEKDRATQK